MSTANGKAGNSHPRSHFAAAGRWLLLAAITLLLSPPPVQPLDPTALSAVELARRLVTGELAAERVTAAFLERIAALDTAGPELRALLEVNPDALAIARELDRRFAESGPIGPLHGVPVVIKGSIDTADKMATSAGSLALAGHYASEDAALVRQLRAAGAVLLAKANMSEWANFRSTRSISGWSSLGGQTKNPYVLDRNPCGSSSGSAVAVAARLAPLAVGTETDGSIVCPAGANGVVGIKPTVGRVSPAGIVPLAASQDTAGPLARTAEDAALLLRVLAASDAVAPPASLRTAGSASDPLAGLRLGVVRDYAGAGSDPQVEAAFSAALAQLAAAGAVLVDPIRLGAGAELRAAELTVLLYEFKAGVDRYLADVRDGPRSLEEVLRFNAARAAEVMPHFGQELLLAAAAKGTLADPEYRAALAAGRDAMRTLLLTVFAEHALDALVAPANGPAWRIAPALGDRITVSSSSYAAMSGFPSIAVPIALAGELPLGLALLAPPNAEELLVAIAAELERRRGQFPAPRFLPTLPGDVP